MLGSWDVKVVVNSLPQKVATAVGNLSEQLIGAEYTPIAYLGSQVVNGINHAVLAEQLVTTGKDTKNVVVLIFNEKGMDCTLVNIERVVDGGPVIGGTVVDVKTDIPEEAMDVFKAGMEGYVGCNYKPFALLATKMTKGMNYVFAVELEGITPNPVNQVALVTINAMTKSVGFTDLLETKQDLSLGYAFTWLRKD